MFKFNVCLSLIGLSLICLSLTKLLKLAYYASVSNFVKLVSRYAVSYNHVDLRALNRGKMVKFAQTEDYCLFVPTYSLCRCEVVD